MSKLSSANADIIVIGAGIVGASCAHRLAAQGYRILLLDNASPSATAAGMGHLVCLDDSPAELALCHYSIAQWRSLASGLSDDCAWRGCGTLWLASGPDDMAIAETKRAILAGLGIETRLFSPGQVAQQEPMLRPELAGGLLVPGDAIVYAPNAARWLIRRNAENITLRQATVVSLDGTGVLLDDGSALSAPAVVLANGIQAKQLLPELPLRTKKGHIVITDRYPPRVHHQLVELGYAASAHASDGTSVAFNVQPRPTGQLLIGSSRQFDDGDPSVNLPVLRQMLRRAQSFLPALGEMTALRSWTGFRAASPDGLPLLGAHPQRPGLWLAVGHEGLGVTTSLGSADLLCALIQSHSAPFDPGPYLASRFLTPRQNWKGETP